MNFIESVRRICYFFILLSGCMEKRKVFYDCDVFLQVFSFVFGDGDPNEGIEEERWKLVIIKI